MTGRHLLPPDDKRFHVGVIPQSKCEIVHTGEHLTEETVTVERAVS